MLLLWRNISISRFYEHLKKFREICFARIFAKFTYLAKKNILTEDVLDHHALPYQIRLEDLGLGLGHFDPLRIFLDNSKASCRSDSILETFYRHSLRPQKFQTSVISLLESFRCQ